MLSILLINDNKIVSRLLQLSSKKSGFDLEENGVFAPEKESYNMIFVDSDKYSDELIDKIKENLTYDKLVFIGTAQVKKPEGFELVLEKPFLPTDFTSLVEKNFITENTKEEANKKNDDEVIDFDKIDDEEIDEVLKDDDLELENIDESLELDSSPENLAQMVDEIDEIDEEQNDKSSDSDIDDIDSEEEFSIDDDLLLDEEDESLDNEEDDVELPKIDDELEDIEEVSEENEDIDEIEEDSEQQVEEPKTKSLDDEIKSIDKTQMKQLIEPNDIKTDEVSDDEEQPQELCVKDNEEENSNLNNLEDIVAQKLKEIITPKLLQDALKGLSINITFGDKE